MSGLSIVTIDKIPDVFKTMFQFAFERKPNGTWTSEVSDLPEGISQQQLAADFTKVMITLELVYTESKNEAGETVKTSKWVGVDMLRFNDKVIPYTGDTIEQVIKLIIQEAEAFLYQAIEPIG